MKEVFNMSNPNVGMIYPCWAPIESHEDGSMPVYGTGMVIEEARKATVTKQMNDNPFYGDDRIVDDDNGMTGLNISFESTGLTDAERVALLGETADTSTDGGQWEDDTPSPWGGFGYIRKMRLNGVRKFEAYLTLKIKWSERTQETTTREGQIQWNAPTLEGNGAGLIVDATEKVRFRKHKTFDTAAAAKAWLQTHLNISTTTT